MAALRHQGYIIAVLPYVCGLLQLKFVGILLLFQEYVICLQNRVHFDQPNILELRALSPLTLTLAQLENISYLLANNYACVIKLGIRGIGNNLVDHVIRN